MDWEPPSPGLTASTSCTSEPQQDTRTDALVRAVLGEPSLLGHAPSCFRTLVVRALDPASRLALCTSCKAGKEAVLEAATAAGFSVTLGRTTQPLLARLNAALMQRAALPTDITVKLFNPFLRALPQLEALLEDGAGQHVRSMLLPDIWPQTTADTTAAVAAHCPNLASLTLDDIRGGLCHPELLASLRELRVLSNLTISHIAAPAVANSVGAFLPQLTTLELHQRTAWAWGTMLTPITASSTLRRMVLHSKLDNPLLTLLLVHTPALADLTVGELALTHNQQVAAAWDLTELTVLAYDQEGVVEQGIARLPQPAAGVCSVKLLGNKKAAFDDGVVLLESATTQDLDALMTCVQGYQIINLTWLAVTWVGPADDDEEEAGGQGDAEEAAAPVVAGAAVAGGQGEAADAGAVPAADAVPAAGVEDGAALAAGAAAAGVAAGAVGDAEVVPVSALLSSLDSLTKIAATGWSLELHGWELSAALARCLVANMERVGCGSVGLVTNTCQAHALAVLVGGTKAIDLWEVCRVVLDPRDMPAEVVCQQELDLDCEVVMLHSSWQVSEPAVQRFKTFLEQCCFCKGPFSERPGLQVVLECPSGLSEAQQLQNLQGQSELLASLRVQDCSQQHQLRLEGYNVTAALVQALLPCLPPWVYELHFTSCRWLTHPLPLVELTPATCKVWSKTVQSENSRDAAFEFLQMRFPELQLGYDNRLSHVQLTCR